jgi:hypothetical protein
VFAIVSDLPDLNSLLAQVDGSYFTISLRGISLQFFPTSTKLS